MSNRIQILSIGSPHGDDQVGWLVADLLRKRGIEPVQLVQSVDQMLWNLTPDCRTIIVDACQSGSPIGSHFRLEWPDPVIETCSGNSSHGMSVPYVLRLADALGKLPKEVVLFAVEIGDAKPHREVAHEVVAAAQALANQIEREVANYRERSDA